MQGLARRIVSGSHAPLPASTSTPLRSLVAGLLSTSPANRPAISEVLRLPFIRPEIAAYVRDRVRPVVCVCARARACVRVGPLNKGGGSGGRGHSAASAAVCKSTRRVGGSERSYDAADAAVWRGVGRSWATRWLRRSWGQRTTPAGGSAPGSRPTSAGRPCVLAFNRGPARALLRPPRPPHHQRRETPGPAGPMRGTACGHRHRCHRHRHRLPP
jgi:hypothetical protein